MQRHSDTGRFAIHELLRQYAAARRRASDPHEEVELAHCRAFARLTAEVISGEGYIPFVPPRIAAEMDNILRAWRYALAHALVDEIVSIWPALSPRTITPEGLTRESPSRKRNRRSSNTALPTPIRSC